jgi:type VI secretion system protein VasD
LAWLAALFPLFACGSAAPATSSATSPASGQAGKPCQPVELEIHVTATARLNAAASGDGRPVQLRLYQLKNDATLRTATFEEIWQNDQAILKDELLKREERTIYPGKTERVELKPEPGATKLVVVALFREPQDKDWFLSYELAHDKAECPKRPRRFSVRLDGMQIQDAKGKSTRSMGY